MQALFHGCCQEVAQFDDGIGQLEPCVDERVQSVIQIDLQVRKITSVFCHSTSPADVKTLRWGWNTPFAVRNNRPRSRIAAACEGRERRITGYPASER